MVGLKRYFLLFFVVFLFSGYSVPERINKLIAKEVKLAFNTDSFEKEAIVLPNDFTEKLPSEVTNTNFQRVLVNGNTIGYYYFGKAFGKVDYFDFVVIFDTNLNVSKVKILVYREDHGAEIRSKRWLKQFIGKSIENELNYPKNIVGISGATLSVQSMTKAVNDVFKTIQILKEKQLL
jgi:Na+-translocating ferredoxin:NAD+ oxidoreductase RnfG subunit